MNEIIKITESNGQRLVSAKELYQFLSIDDGSNFSKWARTNIEEMFSHNVDYQNLRVTYENGGRPAADYALTIDCAKQVAMMSRCEKGRIAREYFIAMEKIAQQSMIQLPDFNNPAIAARAWADQYERRELAESKVKELSPKAEVFDRISNTDNLLTMNEAAKSLGISRPKLFAVLRGRNVLMANNLPYQLFIDKKLFKVKDKVIQMGDKSMVYPQTFVTGKGVAWIGKGLIKIEKETI
jgi:anti-repressor protein